MHIGVEHLRVVVVLRVKDVEVAVRVRFEREADAVARMKLLRGINPDSVAARITHVKRVAETDGVWHVRVTSSVRVDGRVALDASARVARRSVAAHLDAAACSARRAFGTVAPAAAVAAAGTASRLARGGCYRQARRVA